MGPTFLGIVVGFVVLSILFGIVERLFPSIPGRRVVRAGFWLDVCYWGFTPLVTKTATRVAVIVFLVPTAAFVLWLAGRGVSRESFDAVKQGFGPLARQPIWLQAIEMLVIGDFIGYWLHRMFHRGAWWPFHAVHHSSTELDWLGAVRLHPVNDAVSRLGQAAVLLGLGFVPTAVAGYGGFLTLYAIFLHANLSWDLGPLRGVIASPRFHRWHHTKEAEALNKNFAGFFPLWDIVFGTYYMPRGKVPTDFGVPDAVPMRLWGQLIWPFRARKSG